MRLAFSKLGSTSSRMISAGFVVHRIITHEGSLSRKIVTLISMGDSNNCPTIVGPRESFQASRTFPENSAEICE